MTNDFDLSSWITLCCLNNKDKCKEPQLYGLNNPKGHGVFIINPTNARTRLNNYDNHAFIKNLIKESRKAEEIRAKAWQERQERIKKSIKSQRPQVRTLSLESIFS